MDVRAESFSYSLQSTSFAGVHIWYTICSWPTGLSGLILLDWQQYHRSFRRVTTSRLSYVPSTYLFEPQQLNAASIEAIDNKKDVKLLKLLGINLPRQSNNLRWNLWESFTDQKDTEQNKNKPLMWNLIKVTDIMQNSKCRSCICKSISSVFNQPKTDLQSLV